MFTAVSTQWRYGGAGPTGLDYHGIRAHPAFRSLRRSRREVVLAEVSIIERAWLQTAAEVRERERERG